MSPRPAIYLDANAGLPPLTHIRERLTGTLSRLYNPSSSHEAGRQAKSILREAQSRVQDSLARLVSDLTDRQWIWTSGGTEGLQSAIRATIVSAHAKVWFYSPVEHSGSLGWLSQLNHYPGCSAVPLPIDQHGRVDTDRLRETHEKACAEGKLQKGDPFLVSFLWVNNETGIVQNQIETLLRTTRELGGYTLVDAAQAWGKISSTPISLQDADWVVTSGHKLGAFSGTGVLAFSSRARKLLESCPSYAGTQQFGLRAGTENLIGAWSLGEAAQAHVWSDSKIQSLRDDLESKILAKISGTQVQGRGIQRVGNTLNVSFDGVPSKSLALTDLLDLEGFSVSSGSACSSGLRKPSHVLKALGHSDELALATLRISLSPDTEAQDLLENFFPALCRTVEKVRKTS
ncbi:aminotransferase class V-fold PLP-dependent enzyme [bacterium]|nr:aminotransferase class V-fold PLP-dependent enzyme [bacterium]